MDHVGAIAAIKRKHPAVPVHLHPADLPLYRAAAQHGLLFGATIEQPPEPDAALADGQTLTVGTLSFTVLRGAGTRPRTRRDPRARRRLRRRLPLRGSVGRTDLPGANGTQLARSLDRIVALGAETVVYSGHGPATTIARELAENPFLNGVARVAGGG